VVPVVGPALVGGATVVGGTEVDDVEELDEVDPREDEVASFSSSSPLHATSAAATKITKPSFRTPCTVDERQEGHR
jgi:hypothetical protein